MSDQDDFNRSTPQTALDAAAGTEGGAQPIVYVREVAKEDLPNPESIPSNGPFYAVHDAEGRPLALFDDRAMAFVVARNHNMSPVSAH